MASQVAVAVHRSLFLLIAKSKCVGFTYEGYTKLYDGLVQSVIDICKHCDFKYIDAGQYRARKFFLRVPCKTPNTAVQGEMRWLTTLLIWK